MNRFDYLMLFTGIGILAIAIAISSPQWAFGFVGGMLILLGLFAIASR